MPQTVTSCAVRSYRTLSPLPVHPTLYKERGAIGGLLSAALSVGSRPPGVTWHSALWSPDFPPLLTQYHLWKYREVTAAAAWPTPGGRLPRNLAATVTKRYGNYKLFVDRLIFGDFLTELAL